jgi:hypothetical protein
MMPRKYIAIAGALAVVLLLIVLVERQRNCRYADGVYCELFGTRAGKYGGPQ